jgi:hypothetical protein
VVWVSSAVSITLSLCTKGQDGSFGFTCVHLHGEQFSARIARISALGATLSTEEVLAAEQVAWVDMIGLTRLTSSTLSKYIDILQLSCLAMESLVIDFSSTDPPSVSLVVESHHGHECALIFNML